MSNTEDTKLAAIIAAAAAFLAVLLGVVTWMLFEIRSDAYALALRFKSECRVDSYFDSRISFNYASSEICDTANGLTESTSGWYYFALVGAAILAVAMVVVALFAIIDLIQGLYEMWRMNRAINAQYKRAVIDRSSKPDHGPEMIAQVTRVAENVEEVADRLDGLRLHPRKASSGLSSRELNSIKGPRPR